jgi:hypothetical protein
MDKGTKDPLRFVSYLFEVAVLPFEAVGKYEARRQPFSDQHNLPTLLLPTFFLLVLPLCLLITLAAIAYTICVVPIVLLCQLVPRFAVPFMVFVVAIAVGAVMWGVSRGEASFSWGLPELTLAGVVMVILVGHQLPRLWRLVSRSS